MDNAEATPARRKDDRHPTEPLTWESEDVARPAATSGDAPTDAELAHVKAMALAYKNEDFVKIAPAVVLDLIARIEREHAGWAEAFNVARGWEEECKELRARTERAAAPATASGDELRTEFERTEEGSDLSRAWGFGCDESEYANPYVQNRWIGYQRGRAAVSAATKPTACALPPDGWTCTRTSGHEGPCAAVPAEICADDYTPEQQVIYQHGVEDGKLIARGMARYNAGVAARNAATKPAAAPTGYVPVPKKPTEEMLRAGAEAWQKSLTQLDWFAAMIAAAPAATPAAQDQADQSHVMPPTRGTGSQHGASVSGWRSIESAPRDGSQILLTNGLNVAQGWFINDTKVGIEVFRDSEGRYVDEIYHEGYQGWMDCEGGMEPDPTHWMPLPRASSGVLRTGEGAGNADS